MQGETGRWRDVVLESIHQRERKRAERALIRADCSGGCWEGWEVGGGRRTWARDREDGEKMHRKKENETKLKYERGFPLSDLDVGVCN